MSNLLKTVLSHSGHSTARGDSKQDNLLDIRTTDATTSLATTVVSQEMRYCTDTEYAHRQCYSVKVLSL